jgi:hypothetical protein
MASSFYALVPREMSVTPPDVQFAWDASDQHITLQYIGPAARLIECGAIEPHMAEKARKGAPRPRCDSAGQRFRREVQIRRRPLSTVLRIVRYIEDAKFAETLPGVPRGLRMKRLDWLDSHPGVVHVTRRRSGDYVVTLTAGTRESLIAAGFPKFYFRSKLLARPGYDLHLPSRDPAGYQHVLPNDGHGTIHSLMRGYLEVEICQRVPPVEKEAKIPPASQSHLRLVVDNSRKAAQAVRS